MANEVSMKKKPESARTPTGQRSTPDLLAKTNSSINNQKTNV
jgi:hypothetical protein